MIRPLQPPMLAMSATHHHPDWRCTAATRRGTRCGNYISLRHPGSHHCWQHQKNTTPIEAHIA